MPRVVTRVPAGDGQRYHSSDRAGPAQSGGAGAWVGIVGISTAAVISSAYGIGYAISTNEAKAFVRELMMHGRIVRVSLGVVGVSVTPQVAYANDLPVDRGVLVVRVEPGSPAGRVGIEPGDIIITRAGGVTARDLHHFHEVLKGRKAGQELEVEMLRDGRLATVRPILGEQS